jgi:transposase-like protein
MYVQGVSTRKVEEILKELCGLEISSMEVSRAASLLDEEIKIWHSRPLGCYSYVFFDARYEKVREGGQVRDCAVLIAFGIDASGKRDILGSSVSLSEHEVHWRQFFESLSSRGLHGIKLLISDAHSGLKAAQRAVFPSVPWQRCQFHLQQNAQSYVTSTKRKREVADSIRAIFNAEDHQDALRILNRTVEKYQKDMPKLSEWMEHNIPEGLACFAHPTQHRRRIRTSNIAERINQELKRRTRVVRIFPSTKSCHRLISALLIETQEHWTLEKIYLQPLNQ